MLKSNGQTEAAAGCSAETQEIRRNHLSVEIASHSKRPPSPFELLVSEHNKLLGAKGNFAIVAELRVSVKKEENRCSEFVFLGGGRVRKLN